MDPFAAQIVAASRREDYIREAAAERDAAPLRRSVRASRNAPRPTPGRSTVVRPVTV